MFELLNHINELLGFTLEKSIRIAIIGFLDKKFSGKAAVLQKRACRTLKLVFKRNQRLRKCMLST